MRDMGWCIRYHMRLAVQQALMSKDPSTQCGAIIVRSVDPVDAGYAENMAFGRNASVLGGDTSHHATDRAAKLREIEHAERSAIYNAARKGLRCDGATMFGTWVACNECAKAIVLAGIKTVWTLKRTQELTPPRWRPSVDDGLRTLRDGGVTINLYDAFLWGPNSFEGDCSILFNGEMLAV